MTSQKTSQTQEILTHLQEGNHLTHRDARELFGCDRLGARIWDLRQAGHTIQTEFVTVKTRRGHTQVARYSLNL